MSKSNLALWAIVLLIIAVVFLPELLMHGMFFDGLTYSSIARNLSEGIGSFWRPSYTLELYQEFYEHPPLALGLQSTFFYIFGDHFFIEKVYSFACLPFVFLGVFYLWGQFKSLQTAWIPILLIMTIPIIFWSFRNNVLENTMAIFSTIAVLSYVYSERKGDLYGYLLGNVFVVLAFLCKGPVGLFPLAVPILYRLSFHNPSRHSILKVYGIVILGVTVCFMLLFLLQPNSLENLSSYLSTQVFPALKNEREITTSSRFTILIMLLKNLAIPIALSIIIFLLSKTRIQVLKKKEVLFFFLVGLSASLPLIVTLKQRDFYLIPSIPFYALALATLVEPYIHSWLERISIKTSKSIFAVSLSGMVLIIYFIFQNFGKYSRDELLINDVQTLSKTIEEGSILGSNEASCYDWSLVAYLMRYGKISLSCSDDHDYFLERKGSSLETNDEKIDLNHFILKTNADHIVK